MFAARLRLFRDVEMQSMDPPQFTLACYILGGNPDNVTWTRDMVDLGSGITQLTDDYREYKSVLSATEEGIYTCTVSNDTPDTATISFNATCECSQTSMILRINSLMGSIFKSWPLV